MELSSDFASMAMMDAMAGNKRESNSAFAEKLFRHPRYKEWAEKHGKALRKRIRLSDFSTKKPLAEEPLRETWK